MKNMLEWIAGKSDLVLYQSSGLGWTSQDRRGLGRKGIRDRSSTGIQTELRDQHLSLALLILRWWLGDSQMVRVIARRLRRLLCYFIIFLPTHAVIEWYHDLLYCYMTGTNETSSILILIASGHVTSMPLVKFSV